MSQCDKYLKGHYFLKNEDSDMMALSVAVSTVQTMENLVKNGISNMIFRIPRSKKFGSEMTSSVKDTLLLHFALPYFLRCWLIPNSST